MSTPSLLGEVLAEQREQARIQSAVRADRRERGIRAVSPFEGGAVNRLNMDWVMGLTSPDQEARMSLRQMRLRCRNLVNNNGYIRRFIRAAQENVIGATGFSMQADAEVQDDTNEAQVAAADAVNLELERAWNDWTKKRNAPEASGRMSFTQAKQLALGSFLMDGELFVRKVKGYPNAYGYSLQFLDPDTLDETFNRIRSVDGQGVITNEIRMSIEVDEWHRPVAYWVRQGHPAEFAAQNRLRIPAEEIIHLVLFQRINQTRGIPWMHAAMSGAHMLGEALSSEVIAGRIESSKMGFFTSKTGDDYQGIKDPNTGTKKMDVAPATFEELPPGMDFKTFDPQHPNGQWPEFAKLLLREICAGVNASYATVSRDVRDVNFSSLRSELLTERDGWRLLQTFAREHFIEPIFDAWLPMALASGRLRLPPPPPARLNYYSDIVSWEPRGWDWVDPEKDVKADVVAIRSLNATHAEVAAKRGKDYRDIAKQRAREQREFVRLGLTPDYSTGGANFAAAPGEQGDTAADPGKGNN